jgi:hypothetical protein
MADGRRLSLTHRAIAAQIKAELKTEIDSELKALRERLALVEKKLRLTIDYLKECAELDLQAAAPAPAPAPAGRKGGKRG